MGGAIDLAKRVDGHNKDNSHHTSKFSPWMVVASMALENDQRAEALERYLKSGSGRAFANRHLW